MANDSTSPHHQPLPWPCLIAGLAIAFLYAIHLIYCQGSPLQFLDSIYVNSDMRANLLWATGIEQQGWLNPTPYHPYTDWMQAAAPYSQWVQWWGGEQIYQQSPLYVYVLRAFLHIPFAMRVFQALLSIGTCIFIGLLAARLAGRTAGWIAFWLAALYAPFYAYTWPFLRDGLIWFLTAAALWALTELLESPWPSKRAHILAAAAGISLGLGFLARETYLLLIPLVWLVLAFFAYRRREWRILANVVVVTVLVVSPLLLRNRMVKAPLLSSSNRLAEAIVAGNAASSTPSVFVGPQEMGPVLRQTQGRPMRVLLACIASHPTGVRGWLHQQFLKILTLFDPFEAPDNLSIYFVAGISPVVKFGLRYWMILPVGLAGLVLTCRKFANAQLWFYLFLPLLLLSILIGNPVSRYRQALMVFVIPWAASFLVLVLDFVRRHEFRKVVYSGIAILAGWVLMLGPLARFPRSQYERPQEYMLSVWVLHQLGQDQKAQQVYNVMRQKFPGLVH